MSSNCGVDVAAQAELQRDVGVALGAGRVDRVEAGDGRKLLLQRQRDGRGHRFGAGPGQAGPHLDRREVHRRQVAHRQQAVGHHPEHGDAQHQQGGGDRPLDEQLGNVHDPAFASPAARWVTRPPGTSRRCPSVTTVSPASSPVAIIDSVPATRETVTARISTVWSGLTR